MKKGFVFFAAAVCFAVLTIRPAHGQDIIGDVSSLPQGTSITVDDFEKGNYWIWAAFDWEVYGPSKLSTSARLSNQWSSQGRQSLECKMIESTPDSSTDGMYYMDYKWDFSGARYVVLDIYNPENKSFDLGIAMQMTKDWHWNETSNISVRPGVHTVVLDLSEYQDELNLVLRINVCYRETTPINGHFFIDNLRIIK